MTNCSNVVKDGTFPLLTCLPEQLWTCRATALLADQKKKKKKKKNANLTKSTILTLSSCDTNLFFVCSCKHLIGWLCTKCWAFSTIRPRKGENYLCLSFKKKKLHSKIINSDPIDLFSGIRWWRAEDKIWPGRRSNRPRKTGTCKPLWRQ